ncbi:MAG: HEAT repeat domain-containing protein [Myxococcota bacterium]|jgi:HEAT repeat protein|nr:HEAT repeat domain-containing protein [Myxococcota bacterium]
MSSFLVPLSLPNLEAALRDAQHAGAEARWVAALALGSYTNTNDPRILEALSRLACDDLEEVRAQAIEGLHSHALTGSKIDTGIFRLALKDPSSRVRCAAVLASAGPAQQDVCAALEDPDENVRACAASALCGSRDPNVLECLAPHLEDPSPSVQFEAARCLAAAKDSRGLQILIELVEQGDERVELALQALGLLGDHRAQSCLRAKLQSWFTGHRVKSLAAAALVRCHDDCGIGVLETQLSGRRKGARMASLSALCTLPIRGISSAIGSILDRHDDEEASSAIVALCALALDADDPEARAELMRRRGRVRASLSAELEEALGLLEEA